ncbi:MAG TPA: hypothetical protein PKD50_26350, partial [Leptospiraceae bacterium]|nr:hypothetical protein [Leptospiraceae bacterium]
FNCKPADPNYRTKPLLNTEYTGFISRNFFQAVVEVPITKEELTILEERKSCLKDAIRKRDTIVLPLLKKIAMEDKWNDKERSLEKDRLSDSEKYKEKSEELKRNENAKSSEEASIFDKKKTDPVQSKNPLMNRGEFSWFLDSMFLYKEDYSNPEKCSFVFRNIQDKLYEKVEKTKLSIIGEDRVNPFNPATTPTNPPPTGATTPANTTSPLNTGLPQSVR